MTKPKSEDNATSDESGSGMDDCENIGEAEGTVMNCDLQSSPNPATASEFPSTTGSSTDLPSLVDNYLTDSMTAGIGLMNSPGHQDSADDADRNSVLSTPPLQPDSDTGTVLPSSERYANGVFSDKIDNLFVTRSPASMLLESLLDECTKITNSYPVDDTDAISKQLDMDVNNLLRQCEGETSKNDGEEQIVCSRTHEAGNSDSDRVSSDAVDTVNDVSGFTGTCEVKNETESSVTSTLANSLNAEAHDNLSCVASTPTEPFPLSVRECSAETNSEGDTELVTPPLFVIHPGASECESKLVAEDGVSRNISWSSDIGEEVTQTSAVEPAISDTVHSNSNADTDSVLNSLSSALVCAGESVEHLPLDAAGDIASDTKETIDVPQPPLPDGIFKREEDSVKEDSVTDASDECKPFPDIIISQCTTVVDNSVTAASLWNTDDKGAFGLFPLTVKRASPVPCMASFSSTSSDGWSCGEIAVESWLTDWKLQTNAVVKLKRLVLPPNQHVPASKYTTGNVSKGIAKSESVTTVSHQLQPDSDLSHSKAVAVSKSASSTGIPTSSSGKLASVQPLLSKMTSKEMDIGPPKTPAREFPVEAASGSLEKSSSSSLMTDMLSKLQQQEKRDNKQPSSASATNVSAAVSDAKQLSHTTFGPPKTPARELPAEAASGLLEKSSSSSLMTDMSSKLQQQEKHDNKQPSAASVTNVLASSSDAKQLSHIVDSAFQRKHYTNYLNNPRYQPVVRLVRLPLEFFRMLQRTSQPLTSSSVSVTDLQKRFVVPIHA